MVRRCGPSPAAAIYRNRRHSGCYPGRSECSGALRCWNMSRPREEACLSVADGLGKGRLPGAHLRLCDRTTWRCNCSPRCSRLLVSSGFGCSFRDNNGHPDESSPRRFDNSGLCEDARQISPPHASKARRYLGRRISDGRVDGLTNAARGETQGNVAPRARTPRSELRDRYRNAAAPRAPAEDMPAR